MKNFVKLNFVFDFRKSSHHCEKLNIHTRHTNGIAVDRVVLNRLNQSMTCRYADIFVIEN